MVALREDARDLHHLTGHYPAAGRLLLRDPPSDERITLDAEPKYAYSEEAKLLQIRLANDQSDATAFYQISDHLIVEIAAGALAGLYVLDLELQ